MCQPEFSSCPSKNKNRHESNNYINNNIHNEKETLNKTELKEMPQKNGKEKPVFILGDSIPKRVNGYEITKKMDNCKVYIKSLSGAKIKCIENCAQPCIRDNPDHIVIHFGYNNLPSKEQPTEISNYIALKLKTDTCQISVSNLTTRNDQYL